jgi:hypothetical protein
VVSPPRPNLGQIATIHQIIQNIDHRPGGDAKDFRQLLNLVIRLFIKSNQDMGMMPQESPPIAHKSKDKTNTGSEGRPGVCFLFFRSGAIAPKVQRLEQRQPKAEGSS